MASYANTVDMEKARELVADQALWPRVRDFLWDFAPQVHESWLENVWGRETMDAGREAGSSLVYGLSSSPRVKKHILTSLGVEPFFHSFPKDDWSRLALLDGATLLEIAKWLGATACADELRRVTDGATVRELKSALRGIYPEVFSFTAYFRGLEAWKFGSLDGVENVAAQVEENGYALLFSAVDALPPQLQLRMRLKLPAAFKASAPPSLRPSDLPNIKTSKHQFQKLLSKLLKLRYPGAYSLCFS